MTFRNFTFKEFPSVYISWAQNLQCISTTDLLPPSVSFPDRDYMCFSLLVFFLVYQIYYSFLKSQFSISQIIFCYFLEIFLSSILLNFAFNVTFFLLIGLAYLFYFLTLKEKLKRNISSFLIRNLFL